MRPFRPTPTAVAVSFALAWLAACSGGGQGSFDGATQDGGGTLDAPSNDSPSSSDALDAGGGSDVENVYDTSVGSVDGCPADVVTCSPAPNGCGPTELCGSTGAGNGLDDDCNGMVDETCPCLPGAVEDCFLGPPGDRAVGACRDGTQRCEGGGEFGNWSACTGGISPTGEVCDNLDNDCNGCADDGLCCTGPLDCPGPDDSRVPTGAPFADYPLRGELFYSGPAMAWSWTVVGGPCDTTLPHPTFTLTNANMQDAVFQPTLSGEYTVTLTITLPDGSMLTCTFVVFIAGPGLRVELCWDTSTTVDLDLYLHTPSTTTPWYSGPGSVLATVNNDSCNWSNCEGPIRGSMGRENWGLANSPLSACQNGPQGPSWVTLGYCANPRLDIDNNLSMGSGLPENINVDNPVDTQTFRVMVQNYTGTLAHPIVNVYCGGHLRGTMGAAPDTLTGFTGMSGGVSVGTMWRAADVVTHVDGTGTTTGCDVTPLHPPGSTSGFYVTMGNPAY